MAKDFDALKRSILNLITPDFRMPLTSVAEYSDKLAQSLVNVQTDEELKNSLRGIQAGGLRLTRLVEDFISLAELKTGEAETAYALHAQPLYDLDLTLREACQLQSEAAKARGIQILCSVAPNLPPILSNSSFLLDSLRRLLEVAIAYCAETDKKIVLSSAQEDDEVHLTVAFAATFNEDEVVKIITIFAQESEDMLGLSDHTPSLHIVKGYAALHGGRVTISYSDRHPHTCAFAIVLPVHAP
jgi:signal transduction histidine kinase